jgi:hydrogenase nickel incorporation protein HypA/HybF
MHEWALAEAILASANETAQKQHLKTVSEVHIKLGQLQQIDQNILKFAFTQLKEGKLKNAKLTIKTQKPKLQCNACGNTWALNAKNLDEDTAEAIHFIPEIAHTYIKCQKCKSPDFTILTGRGIWLQMIKGAR